MMRIQMSTMAVALAAGTAFAGAPDANTTRGEKRDKTESERAMSMDARILSFHRVGSLMGTEVTNADGETVGSISDLVVDRGTGVIGYVVLEHGGVLGIGSDQVAIPYSAFRVDTVNNRLRLNVTPEVMDRSGSQTPPGWVEVDLDDWSDAIAEMRNELLGSGDGRLRDPYKDALDTDTLVTVEGVIESLEREHIVDGPQQVIAVIRTRDGQTKRVATGPSWYVTGQRDVLVRGDTVKIDAFELRTPGTGLLVARNVSADDLRMRLREDDGEAKWAGVRPDQRMDTNDWVEPMVLMSDVIGMDAYAMAEDGGEITDAVMEASSGTVFMLGLDPDENLLGIGDETRCVPWSTVSIGAESVRIDATKDMLETCEKMPDDVQVFVTPVRLETAYVAFDQPVTDFERQARGWGEANAMGGWSSKGDLGDVVRDGDRKTLSGMFKRMDRKALPAGMGDAMVLVIAHGDRTTRVLVGPKWFMERQDASKIIGGEGKVTYREGRVGGQTYRVATQIETKDGKTIRLWEDGEPIWDMS